MPRRSRLLFAIRALPFAISMAIAAPAIASSYALPEAQFARASNGQALAHSAPGQERAALAQAMNGRGANGRATASLAQTGGGLAKTGITHLRYEQQVGGLTVYGTQVKAAFNSSGDLINVVSRLANVPDAAPAAARISEQQALDAAMAAVHPGVVANFSARGRAGATSRFNGGTYFHKDPTVTQVVVPQEDGTLAMGYLVETWTNVGNLLHHTLVGGDGEVLNIELRTASDSYKVFVEDPLKSSGAMATVTGPSSSPGSATGWLTIGPLTSQTTVNISGNNVHAYLDTDNSNGPDAGGTAVTDGNFLTSVNLTQAPSSPVNKAVAVQNLFYLNNYVHDVLYGHGFDEMAGNFQQSNPSGQGSGGDPVNAEAQDGGGVDNANFSTPTDGTSPRMQMYLWTGVGTHEVVVGGSIYKAAGAEFGTKLTTTGKTGVLALSTPTDGCTSVPAEAKGKFALVDRGTCTFVVKAQNAAKAGATGVIIVNNDTANPDYSFTMGGTAGGLKIPAVMVSLNDGAALRGVVGSTSTMRQKATAPLQIDGSLDADIVFHEYGHGLTWRMIGGMSGPLAGALGEGASDVVAFMINGDDRIGEYAFSNPIGVRRAPYTNYPNKYSSVTGAEVHDDGEIYAAAMWRLRTDWLAAGNSSDSLFHTFVDGMNYTPATPAFENMRNGMLDSIRNNFGGPDMTDANGRCSLVWAAFAAYEIGDGAKGTVSRRGTVTITKSTATRDNCTY